MFEFAQSCRLCEALLSDSQSTLLIEYFMIAYTHYTYAGKMNSHVTNTTYFIYTSQQKAGKGKIVPEIE